MEAVIEKLEGLLATWLQDKPEHFLVDIKWLPGNKIQVFLDADAGIKIETCVEVSRYLEKHIDEEGWLGEKYILEVSSPGMDSPLKVLRQYQRRIGGELAVVKNDGVKIEGTLKQYNEQGIELESVKMVKGKIVETNTYQIPFTEIKTAKLKFNF
ncbi:ribosome maturation factor RimP [soil metagenome]